MLFKEIFFSSPEILVRYGVDLSSQEFLDLLTKYDLKENGQFCYSDFLRHFILNLKPQDEPKSLLARRKIATPKLAVCILTLCSNAPLLFTIIIHFCNL
jgi:hypothetical protein